MNGGSPTTILARGFPGDVAASLPHSQRTLLPSRLFGARLGYSFVITKLINRTSKKRGESITWLYTVNPAKESYTFLGRTLGIDTLTVNDEDSRAALSAGNILIGSHFIIMQ